jgi:hypothetical protein
VLLEFLLPSALLRVPIAQAPHCIVPDIAQGIDEASPVEESIEKTINVRTAYLVLLLKVIL